MFDSVSDMFVVSGCPAGGWLVVLLLVGLLVGVPGFLFAASCCGAWLFFGACFGFFMMVFCGEFDPGSGRTLAACLTHASRTMMPGLFCSGGLVANG